MNKRILMALAIATLATSCVGAHAQTSDNSGTQKTPPVCVTKTVAVHHRTAPRKTLDAPALQFSTQSDEPINENITCKVDLTGAAAPTNGTLKIDPAQMQALIEAMAHMGGNGNGFSGNVADMTTGTDCHPKNAKGKYLKGKELDKYRMTMTDGQRNTCALEETAVQEHGIEKWTKIGAIAAIASDGIQIGGLASGAYNANASASASSASSSSSVAVAAMKSASGMISKPATVGADLFGGAPQ